MRRFFRWEFEIPPEAIDDNRHVNNVQYVQWMQDVAISHATYTGGTAAANAVGGVWFALSHHIDYASPAFEGEHLLVVTWIVSLQRVRSRRRYCFLRATDLTILASAESEWVFVNAKTGRPRGIPSDVASCFEAVGEEEVSVESLAGRQIVA
jgi:acyl-CoA thioester hydrolase